MISQDGKSFAENINVLLEELRLAIQWNRPSILLAICRSSSSQVRAQNDLKNRLQQLGMQVMEVRVNSHSPFVSNQILSLGNPEKTVFFISNIDWGGGSDGKDAYRNLNMERETFVENQIKAVFWLTKIEAQNLPTYATDFWAFRHQVVEFAASRAAARMKLPAGILIWHGQNIDEAPEKVAERIETYNRFLRELPDRPESLSSRLELLYTIGYLYWVLGDAATGRATLQSGIGLAHRPELSVIRTWLLNGMAIIHYEAGETKEAAAIYQDLIAGSPGDGLLKINFGVTLSVRGRNSAALSEGQKAAKLIPTDPRIWNRLGCLYLTAGKLDEAVPVFERAIELAPAAPDFRQSLAICYFLLGLTEQSLEQIRIASQAVGQSPLLKEIYLEALQGESEQAWNLLQADLASGRIGPTDLRRDFNLQMLFGRSLLEGPTLR